jgi:endonuclease/exonuclease/phosphatase family metal-dependent hydrolase
MSRHSFLSVNMRRRNAAMHSLLETNTLDDVLFVQEPWFSRIGVERSDKEREGIDVLGGAKHPDWDLFYPQYDTNKRAKVMTYRRKQVNNRLSPIQIIPRLDLAKHPTILITDIRVHKDTLRVINFYNDMDDPSSINTLLQLDLDPTVPTMLVGDFNLHSRTWSPQNWERSTKSPALEQWAAAQTFSLHTQPGDITRQGLESERPSTLDLTWHNWVLEVNLSITPPTLDWESSLGSDHCGIRSLWFRDSPAKGDKRPFLSAFKAGADLTTEKEWKETLATSLPTITPISTVTFRLGLVVSRERSVRTTIGTVFVHTSYFLPTLIASLLSCVVSCDVSVMCCVALFCVLPRPSDTSIGVLGFVTRSTVREELQSRLRCVYMLRT